MSWNSIINQSRVKNTFAVSLKRDRLAHAYLFSGQEGVGKYAVAIEIAKVINCDRKGQDACDECPSCMKFQSLQHPNVSLIFPLPVGKNEKHGDAPLAKMSDDEVTQFHEQIAMKAKNPYHPIEIAKATTIKVNSIREIRKESSMSAFTRGKKVFIILDADTMNDEAANALLKTLEEPHEGTLLILTTSRVDALLPTIISRCQHIRFDPLTDTVIEEALRDRETLAVEDAQIIARLARGSYTRALQYIHSSLHERREAAVELFRTMLLKSRKDLLEEIDRIVREYEKNEFEELLQIMQHWLRDAMMKSEGIDGSSRADETESVRKFIQRYPLAQYGESIDAIDRAISLLYKNVYIPLIVLDLASTLKSTIDPPLTKQRSSLSATSRRNS